MLRQSSEREYLNPYIYSNFRGREAFRRRVGVESGKSLDSLKLPILMERSGWTERLRESGFDLSEEVGKRLEREYNVAKYEGLIDRRQKLDCLPVRRSKQVVNVTGYEDEVLKETDLASVIVAEAAEEEISSRVMVHYLTQQDNKLWFMGEQKAVPLMRLCNWENSQADVVESLATRSLEEILIRGEAGLWMSPPNKKLGYQREGRVTIYQPGADGIVSCYGICTDLEGDQYEEIYERLVKLLGRQTEVKTLDDIRVSPIGLNKEEMWSVLRLAAPEMNETWDWITSGGAEERTQRALVDVRKALARVQLLNKRERSREAERQLIKMGWGLQRKPDGCVDLNINGLNYDPRYEVFDYVGGPPPMTYAELVWGPIISSEKKRIFNCGACKEELNEHDSEGNKVRGMMMKAGDTCPHCKGVYQGC